MSLTANGWGSLWLPQEGTAGPSGGRQRGGESGVDGLQTSTETQALPQELSRPPALLTAYCVLLLRFLHVGPFQPVVRPSQGKVTFLFYFIFYWRIIALHCCVSFCQTTT